MPKPKKQQPRQTALFDIRLRSTDRDVLLLKGAESDASSVLLSGVVVLSVIEPLTVKKLSLKLTAMLRLRWDEVYKTPKTSFTKPVVYNKMLYNFEWDPLNINEYLQQQNNALSASFLGTSTNATPSSPGFTTGKLVRSNPNSSTSLQSISNSKSTTNLSKAASSKSSTNLASSFASFTSVSAMKNSESVVLQQGNYEFPFSTIVDGSVPESIEGLPGCSIVYRLQASIERGRFQPSLVTKKHVHIIRTLTTDASELTETVAVDNTWPKKVDYSISVPARAVAIGSTSSVEIIMVPLMKNLRLGSIKMKLVEYYSYCGNVSTHQSERPIAEKTLSKITIDEEGQDVWKDAPSDLEGVFYRSDEITLSQDRWEVNTGFQIPNDLGKVTQDCDVGNYVKVRHKIKFVIGLINPDGHVSELRATLPVMLFISPFIPIISKPLKELDDSDKYSTAEDVTVHFHGEDVLFESELSQPMANSDSITSTNATTNEPASSSGGGNNNLESRVSTPRLSSLRLNTQDIMAPPNYEHHIYDRVYSENASGASTPLIQSGAQTPSGNMSSSVPNDTILGGGGSGGSDNNDGSNSSSGATSTRPYVARGASVNDFSMTPAGESSFSSQLYHNLKALQRQQNSGSEYLGGTTGSSAAGAARSLAHLASSSSSVGLHQLNVGSGVSTPAGSAPKRGNRPVFSLSGDGGDEIQDYFSYDANQSHNNTNNNAAVSGVLSPGTVSNNQEDLTFSTGHQIPIAQTPGGMRHNLSLMSPGVMSPVQHLSRVNSYIGFDTGSGDNSDMENDVHSWDNTLSKVPSYETALKSDNVSKDFTPAYEPPSMGSSINLELLNARLRAAELAESSSNANSSSGGVGSAPPMGKSSSLTHSANNKTPQRQHSGIHLSLGGGKTRSIGGYANSSTTAHAALASELAKSRGSSTNSSPAMSRNHSSSNLLSFSVGGSSGMTPMGDVGSSSGGTSSPNVLFPKAAHLHTVTHAPSGSLSGSGSSSNPANTNSAGGATPSSSERPGLVSRSSMSSFHLGKKGGSFVNLGFLHKKSDK